MVTALDFSTKISSMLDVFILFFPSPVFYLRKPKFLAKSSFQTSYYRRFNYFCWKSFSSTIFGSWAAAFHCSVENMHNCHFKVCLVIHHYAYSTVQLNAAYQFSLLSPPAEKTRFHMLRHCEEK